MLGKIIKFFKDRVTFDSKERYFKKSYGRVFLNIFKIRF
jgi:hypothetical protein